MKDEKRGDAHFDHRIIQNGFSIYDRHSRCSVTIARSIGGWKKRYAFGRHG